MGKEKNQFLMLGSLLCSCVNSEAAKPLLGILPNMWWLFAVH